MKTKLIIIALSLTITSFAMACPDGKRAEMRKNKAAEKLNLTDDQRVKFESIMHEKAASLKAAKELVNTDTKAKLAEVLTAEQMQMVEERKHKHHRRMRKEK